MMDMQLLTVIILGAVLLVLIVLCILLLKNSGDRQTETIRKAVRREERIQANNIYQAMSAQRTELNETVNTSLGSFGTLISGSQETFREQMEQRMSALERSNTEKLTEIRTATEQRLTSLQKDNNERLEKMETLVDEKLQASLENRITQSFRLVSAELEKVYKGLGEMQTVASGVNDLKKVLSNVKTRGILGEVQLGAILNEILAPEQILTNVCTKKDSRDPVEYAVRLPGKEEQILLPIDAKFPGETYASLVAAYDSGSAEKVNEAAAKLIAVLKKEAKDISDKYIDPPRTTDFAVMFLPFEGLYAEAVNRGMVEALQREYKVNLAGPSTMAAFLNSLQMGFKTLAIQERTAEVWHMLASFRTEFDKFREVLEQSQKHLKQASGDLEQLIGVRTRSIQKELNAVELYSATEGDKDGE